MLDRLMKFVDTSPALAGHLLMLITAIGLVGGAWYLQLFGGIYPCPLCLLQRLPWYAGGALALVAIGIPFIAQGLSHLRVWGLLGQLGLMGWSVYLSVEHIGVEQQWWGTSCTLPGQSATPATIDDLLSMDEAILPPCDAIQWELFGITLAGYNLLTTLGMIAVLIFLLLRSRKAA